MKLYYALVHKDTGSAYGITFPDLPGCFAAADLEANIFDAAQEAMVLYVRDETRLPKPRSLVQLQRDQGITAELAAGAALLAVPIIETERKARYNVMLDVGLVAGIDRKARTLGISRSEFLARAAAEHLAAMGAGAITGSRKAPTKEK